MNTEITYYINSIIEKLHDCKDIELLYLINSLLGR